MIQSTDLRLGNLVKYKGEIVKVFEIQNKFIGAKEGNSFPYFLLAERFNPIPITAEFFKERGYGYDYHHNDITINSDYRVEFSLSKGYLIDGYGLIVEIEYIHELQNLYYALTKTELEL